MHTSPSRKAVTIASGAVVALAAVIAVLLIRIPAVKGLGNKVKLPLFHGASTWVDLMLFVAMGLVALLYLATRSEKVYAWEGGLRAVASPLWLLNTALGYTAAMNTWDFSASKESPLVIARQDPRLMAQVYLLIGVAIMLLFDWLVLEKRIHKAIVDVVFVAVTSVLMADLFINPAKRALHPDSPVLNSGWEIKAPFFGIVVAILGITLILSWLARAKPVPEPVAEDAER